MADLFIENYLKSLDLFNRAKSFIQKKKLNIAKISLEKALILFPSEYIPSDKKELFELKRNILSTLKMTYKKSWSRKGGIFLNIKFALSNPKNRKYIYLTLVILLVSFFSFSNLFVEEAERFFKKIKNTSKLQFSKNQVEYNIRNVELNSYKKITEKQRELFEKEGIEVLSLNVVKKSNEEVVEIDVVYDDNSGINKTNFILKIFNAMENYSELEVIVINLRERNGMLLNSIRVGNNAYKKYKSGKISPSEFIDKWEIINR